jgi:ubiquinol-cytochrome c reductase iron-sulfur subunit
LYEQQTHNLLCPCHQSTFFVPDACAVLFGPAARSLPQLPIYADAQGFIRARASFDEPLGPSFWERR